VVQRSRLPDWKDKAATNRNYDWCTQEEGVGKSLNLGAHVVYHRKSESNERAVHGWYILFKIVTWECPPEEVYDISLNQNTNQPWSVRPHWAGKRPPYRMLDTCTDSKHNQRGIKRKPRDPYICIRRNDAMVTHIYVVVGASCNWNMLDKWLYGGDQTLRRRKILTKANWQTVIYKAHCDHNPQRDTDFGGKKYRHEEGVLSNDDKGHKDTSEESLC